MNTYERKLAKSLINNSKLAKLDRIETRNLKKPNSIPSIRNKLLIRGQNEIPTTSIKEYLNKHDSLEKEIYTKFKSYVLHSDSMNPHVKPYPLREYFVEYKTDGKKLMHLVELEDLLNDTAVDDEIIMKIVHYNRLYGGILHVGEKGSGKTFSQNVWLHDNHKKFEENKIFWVRLDAAKLFKLWSTSTLENANLTTVKEYLIGQLLYVFCKHFNPNFPGSSLLLAEIAEKLKESSENNIKPSSIKKKYDMKIAADDQEIFSFVAEKKGIEKVTDYFEELERQISVYEGLNVDACVKSLLKSFSSIYASMAIFVNA